jgi:hypothetical protein
VRGEDAKEDDKLPEQQPRIVVLDAADGLAGTGKEGTGVFYALARATNCRTGDVPPVADDRSRVTRRYVVVWRAMMPTLSAVRRTGSALQPAA